jgi:TetR/AcrR family acrAB operon transcriptional repressor/TetR/AcrR family transcriptional repressor of mexAB-oprM operon
MVRRTKTEAEATRESLLDAAEQVFLEKGYAKSSLEEIARRAGVTRGAVYWHFSNKADLLKVMALRVQLPLGELVERMQHDVPAPAPLATLRTLCLCALHGLARDERRQRVYTILLHRLEEGPGSVAALAYVRQAREQALMQLELLFEQARAVGELAPERSPRTAALALQAYMLGIYSSWLRSPASYSLADQAEAMVDIFFRGLSRSGEAP